MDITITKDTDGCFTVEVNGARWPVRQSGDTDELDEFREARRKYKALYYEDICLWIIKNLKEGERDLLVIEVHLRHYKGVDNKPKPYVALNTIYINLG
jgi:hypothetical protein